MTSFFPSITKEPMAFSEGRRNSSHRQQFFSLNAGSSWRHKTADAVPPRLVQLYRCCHVQHVKG